jgi:hypothetical protein
MPGCSLPGNCSLESCIRGYFAIKNQTNPFVPGFDFHRDGRGGFGKTLRHCKNRQVIAMRADKIGVIIARAISPLMRLGTPGGLTCAKFESNQPLKKLAG